MQSHDTQEAPLLLARVSEDPQMHSLSFTANVTAVNKQCLLSIHWAQNTEIGLQKTVTAKKAVEEDSTSCVVSDTPVNSIPSSGTLRIFSTTKNVTGRLLLCQFLRSLTAKDSPGLGQFGENILNSLYESKKMSICHAWSIISGFQFDLLFT